MNVRQEKARWVSKGGLGRGGVVVTICVALHFNKVCSSVLAGLCLLCVVQSRGVAACL